MQAEFLPENKPTQLPYREVTTETDNQNPFLMFPAPNSDPLVFFSR